MFKMTTFYNIEIDMYTRLDVHIENICNHKHYTSQDMSTYTKLIINLKINKI